MNKEKIINLLKQYKADEISEQDILDDLKKMPYEDIDFAKVDHHRGIRQDIPEVIFCQGKSIDHIKEIFIRLRKFNENILLTRGNEEVYNNLKEIDGNIAFHKLSGIIARQNKEIEKLGEILLIAAGTADIPVAEEAKLTAEFMGSNVRCIFDVGVAGLHRLLAQLEDIQKAKCIIAVAGMDGAIVPTVAGIANCPVIAVPTSVGYGASFNGLAALLTMLNTCAPGVGVVNIDNGFGAGYLASMINKKGVSI